MIRQLQAELQRRTIEGATEAERVAFAERVRSSFLEWCLFALGPEGLAPARHHRLLISYLQRVADGEIDRLMIVMPPGSGKSYYTSSLLPAWLLVHSTMNKILAASHTAKLAMRFSGRVQRYARLHAETLGYRMTTEAKDRWETSNDGEYLASGVGGAIPGFRADFAIVDDPIKGREAADSETQRDNAWEWYNGDLIPRMKPNGRIIFMNTRWHQDDLAGRLLETEGTERWTVLSMPAIAIDEDDQLGRAPGEPLWADDAYGYGRLLLATKADLERKGETREWESQYQQNPRPKDGTLFKVGHIQVLEKAPNLQGAAMGRGWDLAATRQIGTRDPDWTAGILLARLHSGLYVVLDVTRFRGNPDEVDNIIHNTARQDGAGTKQSLPQDPGQAGKAQVLAFTRLLSGLQVSSSPETGDKATRAAPVISQVNGGNFAIVRAPWNRAFLDELSAFPQGTKDDQVDALSRAFGIVGLGPRPLVVSDSVLELLGQR